MQVELPGDGGQQGSLFDQLEDLDIVQLVQKAELIAAAQTRQSKAASTISLLRALLWVNRAVGVQGDCSLPYVITIQANFRGRVARKAVAVKL